MPILHHEREFDPSDPAEGPIKNVCPRCANGRPTCVDLKPDGTRYTHTEACASYEWDDYLCSDCDRKVTMEHRIDGLASDLSTSVNRSKRPSVVVNRATLREFLRLVT